MARKNWYIRGALHLLSQNQLVTGLQRASERVFPSSIYVRMRHATHGDPRYVQIWGCGCRQRRAMRPDVRCQSVRHWTPHLPACQYIVQTPEGALGGFSLHNSTLEHLNHPHSALCFVTIMEPHSDLDSRRKPRLASSQHHAVWLAESKSPTHRCCVCAPPSLITLCLLKTSVPCGLREPI